MSQWINLLEVMHPVGSLYLSTLDTSPASTIGGTWSRIEGATLAANGGDNGFVSNSSFGGSLKISVDQMPSHQHMIIYSGRDSYNVTASQNVNSFIVTGVNQWGKTGLMLTGQDQNGNTTFSDGRSPRTGGGRGLYSLPLWSVCLEENCLKPLLLEVMSSVMD